MKLINHSVILVLIFLSLACESDGPTETILPDVANILTLELQVGTDDYLTTIEEKNIVLINQLPYLATEVSIKTLVLSPNNTANIKVGDTLSIENSPISITVSTSDGAVQTMYTLNLDRDEGLNLSPNTNIEMGSSYSLQSSDVYADGWQLNKDPNLSFIQAYADFNGDGHTDVLLSGGIFKSYEYSPVFLYLGNGSGVNANYCECGGECSSFVCNGFTEASDILPADFEGMQHPRKILNGDYNNDGKIDVFILGHGYDAEPFPGESPILLLNNGTTFSPNKLTNIVGFHHGGSSADVDHDGDLDIVLTGSPNKLLLMLINDGDGNFSINTDRIDSYFLNKGAYYTTELIDIDKDGFMDLLIGGHEHEGAATYILWGNSSGKYYKDHSTILPEIEGFKIVTDFDAEDIDNDGDRDIILNRASDGGTYSFYDRFYLQIIEHTDNRTFSDKTSSRISNNEGSPWHLWIHMQDLNNDGNIDIYYETNHSPNLKWINDGAGNFTPVN